MRCERSMIGLSGEIPLMTAWQRPTHSLPSPKSETKTIGRAMGVSMLRPAGRCNMRPVR
jgi:hypothetical protein